MADKNTDKDKDKDKKPAAEDEEQPEMQNAARGYGLEDREATQEDPRVSVIRKSVAKSEDTSDARTSPSRANTAKPEEPPKPTAAPAKPKEMNEDPPIVSNSATTYGLENPPKPKKQDPRVSQMRSPSTTKSKPPAAAAKAKPGEKKEEEPKPEEEPEMSNAARNYGLEEEKANKQDPRVSLMRPSVIKEPDKDEKLARSPSNKAITKDDPRASRASQAAPIPPQPPVRAPSTALLPPPPPPPKEPPPKEPPPKEPPAKAEPPPPVPAEPKPVEPPPEPPTPPPAPVPAEDPPSRKSSKSESRRGSRKSIDTNIPTPKEPPVEEDRPRLPERCASKYTNTDVSFDPSKEFATKTTNTIGGDTDLLYMDTAEDKPPQRQSIQPDPYKPQSAKTQTEMDLDECFEIAVEAVKKAGSHALAANREKLEYTLKRQSHDLLTSTDNEVEAMIIDAIRKHYPEHKFIAEEEISRSETGVVELTDDPTWVIDPIDGTMNFVHHFPYYCISVALLVNKVTELGIVFNPPMKDCYTARRGQGAHLNGDRIKTSGQTDLEKAMILQEYCSPTNDARTLAVMENAKRLMKKAHALRSIGSSAMGLAMIASGVADGFYYFGLHIWDMAAGNLLVTEAGGTVIDPAGGEVDLMSRRVLAASTQALASELSGQLKQNYPRPRDDEPRTSPDDDPGKNKVDFIGQTEFSDSSESLSEAQPDAQAPAEPAEKAPPAAAN